MSIKTVDIRLVDHYDDAVFKALVQRNLHSYVVTLPAWKFKGPGDEKFQKSGTTIRIGAFSGERLVGLSWGESASPNRFTVHMSLVEEEFRNQGIYSRMLDMMMDQTRVFDEVDSHHHVLNNHIIAKKLKYGFVIVGFDTDIIVGPRVKLRFFNNPKLADLMRFRAGQIPNPLDKVNV